MPRYLHLGQLSFVSILLLLALAACVAGAPTGPQQAGTPAADQGAGLLAVFAANTPTWTPTPTLTPTPTSTPTPLPTPTPVAALSVGSVPAGQVLFSTQRVGEAGQQLWRVAVDAGLAEVRSDLLPGAWRCVAGAQTMCAFVTVGQGLYALQPLTGTMVLLDDLTTLPAAALPVSPTLPLTGTETISPTFPLTSTTPTTSTHANNPAIPPSASLPTLSFSPDGATLAVATQDRVTVYDLDVPAVLATLQAGGPAELAWSPDGQQLALAYPTNAGNAVALWSLDDGRLRVLAQMEAAGRLAWAADGSKLAFDARTSPGAPASQGSQPDVYVLYLRGDEIANLTEVFLRNNGVDPASQIGGWAPQWEPDGESVRYVRGIPGLVEQQNVVRQPLRSRSFTALWPVADEGKLGVAAAPDGQRLARVIVRDGRDVVQVRPADGDWLDATPGTFADLIELAWAPAGAPDSAAPAGLLLADHQTLWLLDPTTGSLSGLAVACPDCVVTQAVWLP